MNQRLDVDNATVGIIGLGYVGLPLAQALARSLKIIGLDRDKKRVKKLSQENVFPNLFITDEPEQLSKADFMIITVPTPVTESKEPDLSYVESAAHTAGQHIKKGSIVILESTVYPGVTEDVVAPILRLPTRRRGLTPAMTATPSRT
jgi:UDP-N-acetyl-D-galactosamine dehydrogenase